ncbi:uncharacterized protein LOC111125351 isoform X2 [Crassostrea virginica]
MKYKTASKILRSIKTPGPSGALSGNKPGSAGSKDSPERAAETRPNKNDGQPGGAQRILSTSEATQNATTDTKKKVLMASNTRNDSRQETRAEEDTEKDDSNKITQELKKNLLEKEKELKEIREQLQTLAKDFGIQGDSHVEIISQISSNIKKLETSLADVKKAVFRETKVKDEEHDIEKTKERIQQLHRQEQELFDLKKAVLRPKDTKDEKQTLSTKETLERVNVLHRNVQELESSLDEVRKAILRESKVTDKDIAKTKERIEELHRQEQDLFDLKKAVLRPKDTKDEKQTFSTKETLEKVNALHRNVQELESSLDEVKKAILRESKVTDKDIAKTKERIEELHRQEQELFDLKKAVLRPKDTKDEKQTFSTKETLEKVNALHSKVKDLESNLKDVDKAVFGESVVKDKEHDIGKTKERIKELNGTKDECSEWIKLAFDGELQKVASTKYIEQSQHTMENAKKLAQQLKRTADEYNNHIRKKEEAISDLEQKLRESAAKQQKMQENREKIEQKLNDDLKKLQIEKERLLTRLSEVAGSKLTAGNPNITDLSDSNRPTKIAEQFSELYDNLWTDVFEKLCKNCNMSDRDAIKTLLQYLEKSYASCKEISTERYKNIVAELTLWRLVMPDTETSQKKGDNTPRGRKTPTEGKEKTNISTDDFTMLQKLLDSPLDVKKVNPAKYFQVLSKFGLDVTNLSYIKNTLKSSAEETSALVEEVIWKQMAIEPSMEFVNPYVKKCVRLCWLMVAQDPPVYIKPSGEPGSKFDKDFYREFLCSGKVLDYVVWPALLLHENGPLLHKGVAQPKAKK